MARAARPAGGGLATTFNSAPGLPDEAASFESSRLPAHGAPPPLPGSGPEPQTGMQAAAEPVSAPLLPEAPSGPEHTYATDKQRRLIFAKAKAAAVDEETLKSILVFVTEQDSTAKIPAGMVDSVLAEIAKLVPA